MFRIKILYNDLYYISVVPFTCWYDELSTKRKFLHKAALRVSHTDLTHVNIGSNFSMSLLLHLITPPPLTANSLLSLLKCLLTENPRSVGLSTFFTIVFLNTRHHYWIPFTHCLNNSAKSTAFLCCMYFLLWFLSRFSCWCCNISRICLGLKLHFVLLSLLDILVPLD